MKNPRIGELTVQRILQFVTPRFVNTFFGNKNVTNRLRGGFHKAKFKILMSIFVVKAPFLFLAQSFSWSRARFRCTGSLGIFTRGEGQLEKVPVVEL